MIFIPYGILWIDYHLLLIKLNITKSGGNLVHRPSKFFADTHDPASFISRLRSLVREILDHYYVDQVANFDATKVRIFLV